MPPPVTDTLARVARDAAADLSGLAGHVLAAIDADLPELGRDRRVRELLVTTVSDTLGSALGLLAAGGDPADVPAPPAGLELARRLAQQGVPITALLRAYRLGQAAFHHELLARIAVAAPPDGIAATARDLSAVTFGFVDRVSEVVVAAYQDERDGWLRRRNAARLAAVADVLAGRADDHPALGYAPAGPQIAAVFWCTPDATDPDRRLERAVAAAADALGSRNPLVVAADAVTLWAWYPAPARPAGAPSVPAGTWAAFGRTGCDVAGFRLSHRQAVQVQGLVTAAAPDARAAVTAAADVGPLALLGADPDLLAAWVDAVLGELATDDEQHERLRATLWAYLHADGSLAAAASALHVHKNTVQYRLRKADEIRGRPLAGERVEVEVALLACRLLGATVLRSASPPPAR